MHPEKPSRNRSSPPGDAVEPPKAPGKGTQRLNKGDSWVWLAATCAGVTVLLFLTLVTVVLFHGFRTFWISDVAALEMTDGSTYLGSVTGRDERQKKIQIYMGNRDLYGLDYRWISAQEVGNQTFPEDVVFLERVEKGNFIGYLRGLSLGDEGPVSEEGVFWSELQRELDAMEKERQVIDHMLDELASISRGIERDRLNILKAEGRHPEKVIGLKAQQKQKQETFVEVNRRLEKLRAELRTRVAHMQDSNGRPNDIAIIDILRAVRPNEMNGFQKAGLYVVKMKELIFDFPRESNTEGGLFPAILGTVLMVMLMSVFCMPLGVIAAVYLREYAKEGMVVNLVRIAVNNLAGVPSIVYGMFGLGFFVYGVGGSIDSLFFSERLPLPTFGTGGMLWASLTMALLTVPVVIVSTEEGLNAVPQGVRDGSLALGATKFQTLMRVILPMATPGMLTGLILSIARAAGEVAPLMLVGVVKIVPNLPIDGEFPYLQLERKFMHLGFHIFDVGFQSPNVEAAKPMVYLTTLVLLILVLGMSFFAMYLRNRMKSRYTIGAF